LRRWLVLLLVLAGCGGGSDNVTYAPVDTKAVAPPFTLQTLDGKRFEAASVWKERPLVVLFLASWCSKCATQQDALEKIGDDYGDAVDFVGIAAQDQPDALKDWIDEHDVDYPVGVDPDQAIWRRYAVRTPPAVVLVAPGGKLLRGWPGGVDTETLEQELDRLVRR
jgi:peroxiredoxin